MAAIHKHSLGNEFMNVVCMSKARDYVSPE